jgi:hypothetical protein
MRSPSQGEQRYGRTTAVVTTSWQRTSRPMFPGRPGRWTERTQDAGSDRTYTHASRLRALSCVAGWEFESPWAHQESLLFVGFREAPNEPAAAKNALAGIK